jgi:hypothetical protein
VGVILFFGWVHDCNSQIEIALSLVRVSQESGMMYIWLGMPLLVTIVCTSCSLISLPWDAAKSVVLIVEDGAALALKFLGI